MSFKDVVYFKMR